LPAFINSPNKYGIKLTLNKKKTSWGILFILMLIWGTSFILIKRGLEVFPSDIVGALRIVVSFIVLLPFATTRLKKVPIDKWKYIAAIGILGTGVPSFLFARAQTVIDSSLAGVLNSLTPLFTLIIGLSFFNQRSGWLNVLGVFIGLIGAVGLITVTSGTSISFQFSYALLIILATAFYALQSNILKYYLNEVPPVTITSIGFFVIGIPAIIYLFVFTNFNRLMIYQENAWDGVFYVAMLGMFSSAFAIILYNKLIQLTDAVFASSVTYFVPVIAMIWGTFDGEKFPAISVLFISMIILGVFLVNRNGQRKKLKKKE
jgi:drug/metabolite transporter (DMT)-like permease